MVVEGKVVLPVEEVSLVGRECPRQLLPLQTEEVVTALLMNHLCKAGNSENRFTF